MVRVVVLASSTSDTEPGAAQGAALLLIIGLIAVGIHFVAKKNAEANVRRKAVKDSQRAAEITDLLIAEGDAPRSVVAVSVPRSYVDKKGRRRDQWSPRMLAVTAKHLAIFDDHRGREMVNIGDVVTTATTDGQLDVALSTGFRYRFTIAPDALGPVEQQIRQLAWSRRSERTGPGVSVAAELFKLAELRDHGVIDGADWERAKDLYLGKSEDDRQRAARELRQIYELNRSGVLSDSEFNMKKWDILSRTK